MTRGISIGAACMLVVGLTNCSVRQADWAREFGTALCKHEQECRKVSQSVDCTRPGYWTPWSEELDALREGLVGYSPEDARRCVDLISKLGCVEYPEYTLFKSAECHAAFPGQVAEGEACRSGWVEVCGQDLRCDLRDPATGPLQDCGTCVPTAREGEEVMLRERKECSHGLYGKLDGGTTALCVTRSSVGESCRGPWECLEWLQCTPGSGPGVCASGAAPPDAGAGEPGEECRPDRTRQYDQGPISFDPAWVPPSPPGWCAWPVTCEENRCVDRSAKIGEPCSANTHCEFSGSCLDGVCAAPALFGESCGPNRCADPFFCENGTCQNLMSLCR